MTQFAGLIQSELEGYLTERDVNYWRKELVYISMFLFIFSAFSSVCISIFILLKLNKLKKILNINGILVLIIIGCIASSILYFTFILSEITDELHLPISLFFNFLANSLLFYLLLGNEEALKFINGKIRIFQQTSNCFRQFRATNSSLNSNHTCIDNLVRTDLNSNHTDAENESTMNDDENRRKQQVIQIYVVPIYNIT